MHAINFVFTVIILSGLVNNAYSVVQMKVGVNDGMVEMKNDGVNVFRYGLKTGELQHAPSGCSCDNKNYDCGCCLHVNLPKVGLDNTICTNVTYLVKDVGISLTISLDGKILVNESVSARNPPPLCVGLPHLKNELSICIDLHDLDVNKQAFSGCAKLEVRLLHVIEGDYDLGCFRIPISGKSSNTKDNMKWLEGVLVAQAKKKFLQELKP